NERLDKSFNAKTIDELDELTADLPNIDPYPLPAASLPKNRVVNTELPAAYVFSRPGAAGGGVAGSGRFSPGWLAAWGTWSVLFVMAFVFAVLGIGGWPLLGMAAIGVIMGGRWVMGPKGLGHGRGGRPRLGNARPDEIDRGTDDT